MAAGGGEAGGAAGDQVDEAVVGTDATLAGRANYEIKDAVAAKIADCERVPELSSSSELSATPSAFWEKVWLPEPGRAAEPRIGHGIVSPRR